MTTLHASRAAVPAEHVEAILAHFESDWQSGRPPRIEDFWTPSPNSAEASTPARGLLEELVMIDLEYRWRLAPPPDGRLGPRPLVEDYVRHFPVLGPLERLSVELVGTEYKARHRWGDRPGHPEYAQRFTAHPTQMGDLLALIDLELAAEYAEPVQDLGVTNPEAPPAAGADFVPLPMPISGIAARGPRKPSSLPSVTDLLEALRRDQLLGASQLDEIAREFPTADTRALARELLRRQWLTPYQANRLLQGRGQELMLGPYLLLERLGEGGAGLVFKARHVKMNRVVALKVIRPEALAEAEAVSRFRREIQVLSRLDHPNIVHAHDAGPAGAGYFLAMEYVEGTDLAKMVKQCGPLPVMQACAYIRQAALGLQHAHERGLVHRDIKPHNLILSLREGRIKVADMGLARLPRAANEEATAVLAGARPGGSITPAGAVMMGTLDYLAPEQALDFHRADIRADIYSLGCTLWYLLVGQPPFPAGTLAEKLLSHQSKEPPAIDTLRCDLPAGLAAVLRRLLAKSPEDRYQSPAEVAAAVAPYICAPEERDLEFDPGGWSFRARASTTWAMLWRFARRNKAFTAAVLMILVLLTWSSVTNYRARRQQEEKLKVIQNSVPALVQAADLVARSGKAAEAMRQVDLALEYHPNYAEAYLRRAQLLIAQLQFQKAQADLNRYLQLSPNDGQAKALLQLSKDVNPQDGTRLLALDELLRAQKAFGPSVCLGHEIVKRNLSLREKLAVWQRQIDQAYPGSGLGKQLTLQREADLTFEVYNPRGFNGDLSAFEGIPLTTLRLNICPRVVDLSPLRGMPLTTLELIGTGVADLSPLRGMPLRVVSLRLSGNVKDLSPLQGMKQLSNLDLVHTGVSDFSPLRGMPLEEIVLPARVKGMRVLREMKSLRTINGKTASTYWQEYATQNHEGLED